MKAWHNDPKLKAKTIQRMKRHREMDEIVQGLVWDGKRGCYLGCLSRLDTGRIGRESIPEVFGFPHNVVALLESMFEALPKEHCAWWTIASLEAIPVGADLSGVADRMYEHQVQGIPWGFDDPEGCVEEFLQLLRESPVDVEVWWQREASKGAA